MTPGAARPVASALATGAAPLPALAERAVAGALGKAQLERASAVILLLTPDFARHAAEAVTAVARRAQCTEVAGAIVAGVATEAGASLDQPAAAVMVFGAGAWPAPSAPAQPLLSLGAGIFPAEWRDGAPRVGAMLGDGLTPGAAQGVVWQHGRIVDNRRCSLALPGDAAAIAVSSDLRVLAAAQTVEASTAFELRRLDGTSAADSLRAALPGALNAYAGKERRTRPRGAIAAPLTRLSALVTPVGAAPRAHAAKPVAIVAINADGSVTLAERVAPGQRVAWALRDPAAAAEETRRQLDRLVEKVPNPACALMFSCIGRGPYFHGGEDDDLDALKKRLPGLPLLASYGTGQIAPGGPAPGNAELHHAVVIALLGQQS